MSSPGGVEVGRVSIRVVPDTSKFASKAKKDLEKLSKELKVDVQVELDVDGVKADLEKIKAEAAKTKATTKIDVEVDGDGVARETRRIKNLAQKLVGAIKMTVGINLAASIARIKAEMEVIQKVVEGYNIRIPVDFVGLSKWIGILGTISAILLTMPHLIGAIGGAVNVVGGALALLPAIAAAASFGIAALVVGLKGFGSALSQAGDPAKFEEALKGLTPSAQAAARALAEFREPLKDIKAATQEALFKGMDKPLASMKKLLPPIKEGLVGAAGGIREMAKSWIEMATSQKSVKDAGTIAQNVKKMFQEMKPAAANFGQALKDITVVGSTFLPALGNAVSDVTGKFAAWAQSARESGRLEEIIQNAIDKIKQLGRIIADVTVGLRNLFTGMGNGKDFLDIIEKLTQQFRDWSALKSTQETLGKLAEVMSTVAQVAWDLFTKVFKSAGSILADLTPFLLTLARGIGAVLGGAIDFLTPKLKAMAKWLSDNRDIMVPLAITVISLVTSFKLMVTAANAVNKLHDSIKALKSASKLIGGFVTDVVGGTKRIITAIIQTTSTMVANTARWVSAWSKIAAQAVASAAKTAAAWIAQTTKAAAIATANFIKMAAVATANALKTAAVWVAQMTVMVATTIADFAVMIAVWVANWVRMAAVALAQAARVALAWLIALGPIAIIAAAIIALVALIILNWDNIVAFLTNVWNWIKDLAATVWGAIKDFFVWLWDQIWGGITSAWNGIADFFSGLWDSITSAIHTAWDSIMSFFSNLWSTISTALSDAASAVWDWAKSLPGKIWDALQQAGNKLIDAGKWIIKGLVNGLKQAASAVWDFIKGICEDVWNGVKDFFGVGSPSRLMMQLGRWINEGWAIGLRQNADTVAKQANVVSGSIMDAFASVQDIGSTWADSITDSAPAAIDAVNKVMDAANSQATQKWTGELTAEDVKPLEDRVLDALASGLTVELDGRNVKKSVNTRNLSDLRRK